MAQISLFNFYSSVNICGVILCYFMMFAHFSTIESDCNSNYSIEEYSMFSCGGSGASGCNSDSLCGMNYDTFGVHTGWGSECKCYPAKPIYDATISMGVLIGLFVIFFLFQFLAWWFGSSEDRCSSYIFSCPYKCVESNWQTQSIIFLWEIILLILICVTRFWETVYGMIAAGSFILGSTTLCFGLGSQRSLVISGSSKYSSEPPVHGLERHEPVEIVTENTNKSLVHALFNSLEAKRNANANQNVAQNVTFNTSAYTGSNPNANVQYVQPNAPPAWSAANNDAPPTYDSAPPKYSAASGSGNPPVSSESGGKDLAAQIKELDSLRLQGIITEEEFQEAKMKVIRG